MTCAHAHMHTCVWQKKGMVEAHRYTFTATASPRRLALGQPHEQARAAACTGLHLRACLLTQCTHTVWGHLHCCRACQRPRRLIHRDSASTAACILHVKGSLGPGPPTPPVCLPPPLQVRHEPWLQHSGLVAQARVQRLQQSSSQARRMLQRCFVTRCTGVCCSR